MTFYLGTDRVTWLSTLSVPLFVSHRTLRGRKTFPRANVPWALDSGGFTEVSTYGRWMVTPEEYVMAIRRYRNEIGLLEWASPQDWMNEPAILSLTGLTIPQHQRLTVDNYLTLRHLDADLPIRPVVQGFEADDYQRCADLYEKAGIDLTAEPLVGVGSVCRRQDTAPAETIMQGLRDRGIERLHGFGVKLTGLRRYGHLLASADSMAWSYRARRASGDRRKAGEPRPPCGKESCNHCAHFALAWREQALGVFGDDRVAA